MLCDRCQRDSLVLYLIHATEEEVCPACLTHDEIDLIVERNRKERGSE